MKAVFIVFLVICSAISTDIGAETLRRAYLDGKNNVHIVDTFGNDRQITNTGNAVSLKMAPNKETVGWLVTNGWIAEGDSEPQSEELQIFQSMKIKSIKCTLFIRDFWFWLDGRQIAIDCGGRHFAGWEILYDTKSLKQITSFDQDAVPLEQRPNWSNNEE